MIGIAHLYELFHSMYRSQTNRGGVVRARPSDILQRFHFDISLYVEEDPLVHMPNAYSPHYFTAVFNSVGEDRIEEHIAQVKQNLQFLHIEQQYELITPT